jgi:hypothetical protein
MQWVVPRGTVPWPLPGVPVKQWGVPQQSAATAPYTYGVRKNWP